MDKLFLDTNIVLDLVQKREPFFDDAKSIFNLKLESGTKLLVSDLTFSNVAYICRKVFTTEEIYSYLILLRKFLDVCDSGNYVIDYAISLKTRDFEDAVQYSSALSFGAECIITRNKKDFYFSKIPVMTPSEFLNNR